MCPLGYLCLHGIYMRDVMSAVLPPWIVLDDLLVAWLQEDIGRGDRTSQGIFGQNKIDSRGQWVAKADGVVAGLPIAQRIFWLLNQSLKFTPTVKEGQWVEAGTQLATFQGSTADLLMGERPALNTVMHLSGIATATHRYVQAIATYPTQLVDTRKTTPGLRTVEKYATQVGGAMNHRYGLDDAVMIKDNHIRAAGGITEAVAQVRKTIPYPLAIEVETSNQGEVREAVRSQVEIIMLDNMAPREMALAVAFIREANPLIKIEASGNITEDNIAMVAATGVDFISTSAPITRSPWLDISMQFL